MHAGVSLLLVRSPRRVGAACGPARLPRKMSQGCDFDNNYLRGCSEGDGFSSTRRENDNLNLPTGKAGETRRNRPSEYIAEDDTPHINEQEYSDEAPSNRCAPAHQQHFPTFPTAQITRPRSSSCTGQPPPTASVGVIGPQPPATAAHKATGGESSGAQRGAAPSSSCLAQAHRLIHLHIATTQVRTPSHIAGDQWSLWSCVTHACVVKCTRLDDATGDGCSGVGRLVAALRLQKALALTNRHCPCRPDYPRRHGSMHAARVRSSAGGPVRTLLEALPPPVVHPTLSGTT